MAMTPLALVFLGVLAAGATVGVKVDTAREVRVGLAWLGAVLWGGMGLGAFDVQAQAYAGSRPMPLLAFTGIGLALLAAVVALYQTSLLIEEYGATTPTMGRGGSGGP